MKNMIKIAMMTMAIFTVAISLAQGGGGRQGGGRQGMMGGRQGGKTQLLRRKDVQKDLGITAAQTTEIDAMQKAAQEDMRAAFQDAQGDQDAMRKIMTEMQTKQAEQLAKILTAKQMTRLDEINIQIQGNNAILDEKVQKSLKMTTAQTEKIKKLQEAQQAANQSLMEKMRNQEIDREAFTASMTKNRDAMGVELGKILTAEQVTALKAMGGAKFEADPAEANPQGGRGGRGGGGGN
ncbi:MAG: hypothetical protein K8R88_13595 [Armatimonadetes bacterium]|nr:hypothetical protein [Armatimonadota bacterium]